MNESFDNDEPIGSLAPDLRRQRQSALLRPLNNALLAVSAVGLLLMVFAYQRTNLASYLIVCSSLVVFGIIAVLEWRGHFHWASFIFCSWVNLGVLLLFTLNLLLTLDLIGGMLFGLEFALPIMLAAFLLGSGFMFVFTAADIAVVFIIFWRFFSLYPDLNAIDISMPALGKALPISAFLMMVALMSWLHQRALNRADAQLDVAHRRIIKDRAIKRDLAVARSIQRRLFPPPPQVSPSLQIASRTGPARETSGDFYDFFDLGDGLLGIVVADVTGKSIAAALMMALARGTIRSEARRNTSPASVLYGANETISRDHTAHQMITAFYGVLDTRTLCIRFSSAGHPYPILRRGDRLEEIEVVGMPLGAQAGSRYVERMLQLEPGDQLFLVSDGLFEERNAHREIFGYDRLMPAILAADPSDPQEALDDLWLSVAAFRDGVAQSDDITCVVIQAVPVAATPPPAAYEPGPGSCGRHAE